MVSLFTSSFLLIKITVSTSEYQNIVSSEFQTLALHLFREIASRRRGIVRLTELPFFVAALGPWGRGSVLICGLRSVGLGLAWAGRVFHDHVLSRGSRLWLSRGIGFLDSCGRGGWSAAAVAVGGRICGHLVWGVGAFFWSWIARAWKRKNWISFLCTSFFKECILHKLRLPDSQTINSKV